jgi:hypothetical protein
MLFLRSKLHAETDVRLVLVSLSARPNSLRVWNVDLNNPLEFGRYATARVKFVEGLAAGAGNRLHNPKVGGSNPPPATMNGRNAVAFAS